MIAKKHHVERENVSSNIIASKPKPTNDNTLQSSPLAESARYKRCRKEIFLNGKPSSLLHRSLKHCKNSGSIANSQKKIGSPLYIRDLKEAAINKDPAAYYAILGEYYDLDCTADQEAKHYAVAFYIAEHFGCAEIKAHIYGVISQLIRVKLKTDLTTLSHMLKYKKEFHTIYPQLIALLQVHINDAVTNHNFERLKSIYLNEVPKELLRKNYTYLVEIPSRFAKQMFKSLPDKQEIKSICDLLSNLKMHLAL